MTKRILIAAILALFVSTYVYFFIERAWPVAVPVALAFLPLLGRQYSMQLARLSSVLIFAFVLLGALSIGPFYAPSAILLALAGWGSSSTTEK